MSTGNDFENSRAGQLLISAFVVVVVVAGVVTNLPDAPITRAAAAVTDPVAESTGLDTRWAMFAPDPTRRHEWVDVDVTMADGSHVVWTFEPGDKVIGAFAWTHWTKLMTNVTTQSAIRPDVARRIARQVTGPNQRAVHVTMVLRTENIGAPGEQVSKSPADKVLYQEDLT